MTVSLYARPKAAGAGATAKIESSTDLIFKIVPRAEWEAASGDYHGSAHDRADGFLHFSTAAQLPETLRRYYAGQDDLMLVAVDAGGAGRCAEMGIFAVARRGFSASLCAAVLRRHKWARPIARDALGISCCRTFLTVIPAERAQRREGQ